MKRPQAALLLLALSTACHPGRNEDALETKSSALTKGAITFYLSYQQPQAKAQLSGGGDTARESGQIVQADGVFGKGDSVTTPSLTWPKKNNIELTKPGSMSIWIKPTALWAAVEFPLMLFDGGRKLMVYTSTGPLRARIEDWSGTVGPNGTRWSEVAQGSTSTWASDPRWHLIVITWTIDTLSLSLDGAPANRTTIPWGTSLPASDGGWIYAGGWGNTWPDNGVASYVTDEMIVLDRQMTDGESQWMWQTKPADGVTVIDNPAIPYFGSASVCASAPETQGAVLTCPANKLIARLAFASYGTPTGTCETFATGSCNASTSLSVANAACAGKTTCTVAATDTNFGSTCAGTTKQLALRAVCDSTAATCGLPTAIVSEGSTATVACPTGTQISEVAFASYGAPTGSCETLTNGTCHAAGTLSAVQAACIGKLSCSVNASNGLFGDPCPGTAKKLAIQVKCGPCTPTTCAAQGRTCGSIPDACGGSIDCGGCPGTQICGSGGSVNACGAGACAQANEFSTASLACPAGQKIKAIVYASYGNPWGSCGGFVNGTCHANGTLAAVQTACVGQASCSLSVGNATFGGDPCPGSQKQIKIQVACAFPDGTPCDDGNACTVNDAYQGGQCTGAPASCDDGNPCTDDSCDAVGGCKHARAAVASLCGTSACAGAEPLICPDACSDPSIPGCSDPSSPPGAPPPPRTVVTIDETTPHLEPALTPAQVTALREQFSWGATSEVAETNPDHHPALYYVLVVTRSREEARYLDEGEIHHSTLPLLGRERERWQGQRGIYSAPSDGTSEVHYAVMLGSVYNLIRQQALLGVDIWSAVKLVELAPGEGYADGSLRYSLLADMQFKYRIANNPAGMDRVDSGGHKIGLQDLDGPPPSTNADPPTIPYLVSAAREVLSAAAELKEEAQLKIREGLAIVDQDAPFWIGAGTVKFTFTFDILNLDPTFNPMPPVGAPGPPPHPPYHPTLMQQAWGNNAGAPIALPGVDVLVYQKGGKIVLGSTTLSRGTTKLVTHGPPPPPPPPATCPVATPGLTADGRPLQETVAVVEVTKGRPLEAVCLALENEAAEITDALTEVQFCMFPRDGLFQTPSGFADRDQSIRIQVSNPMVHLLAQLSDAYRYMQVVAGYSNPHKAEVLVGRLADVVGAIPNSAASTPCFAFPSFNDDFMFEILGIPGFARAAFSPILPFYAVDMIVPNVMKFDTWSRGVPTHEYGHFVLCSLLYDHLGGPSFGWNYGKAARERVNFWGLGKLPGPDADHAYVNEAFADFIGSQVVGAVNYFRPGRGPGDYSESGVMLYCNAAVATCLERNFSQALNTGDFDSAVARTMTTLHDAFDGQPAGGDVPGNADYWTMSSGVLTVAQTCNRQGNANDEGVALPGRAIANLVGSNLDGLSVGDLMSALATTMKQEHATWCGACDVLSAHYNDGLVSVAPTGAGTPPSATRRQQWDLCLDPAEQVHAWLGDWSPPDPFLNLNDSNCAHCPTHQFSPDGNCQTCQVPGPPGPGGPPGSLVDGIVFENRCLACGHGGSPDPHEDRCICVGARLFNLPDGTCSECAADEIVVDFSPGGPTCVHCPLGVVPGTNQCVCGLGQGRLDSGLCENCRSNQIVQGGICVTCINGVSSADHTTCVCPFGAGSYKDPMNPLRCVQCSANELAATDHCSPCDEGFHRTENTNECVADWMGSPCNAAQYMFVDDACNERRECECLTGAQCDARGGERDDRDPQQPRCIPGP
jgi:hypothetical protein